MGNRVEPQELPLRRRDFGSVLISRSQGTLPASCSISSTIGQARSRTSHDEIVPSSRPKSRKIFYQPRQSIQSRWTKHTLDFFEICWTIFNYVEWSWHDLTDQLPSLPDTSVLIKGFLAARKASIAGLAIDQMAQSQSGWEPRFDRIRMFSSEHVTK